MNPGNFIREHPELRTSIQCTCSFGAHQHRGLVSKTSHGFIRRMDIVFKPVKMCHAARRNAPERRMTCASRFDESRLWRKRKRAPIRGRDSTPKLAVKRRKVRRRPETLTLERGETLAQNYTYEIFKDYSGDIGVAFGDVSVHTPGFASVFGQGLALAALECGGKCHYRKGALSAASSLRKGANANASSRTSDRWTHPRV